MITQAINKINAEKQKENNQYVNVISDFLIKYINQDEAAAEKILADGKTIMKSLQAMRKEAEKHKVGGVAMLTDEQGFEVVLKYFGINKSGELPKVDIKPSGSAKEEKQVDNPRNKVALDVSLDDLLI